MKISKTGKPKKSYNASNTKKYNFHNSNFNHHSNSKQEEREREENVNYGLNEGNSNQENVENYGQHQEINDGSYVVDVVKSNNNINSNLSPYNASNHPSNNPSYNNTTTSKNKAPYEEQLQNMFSYSKYNSKTNYSTKNKDKGNKLNQFNQVQANNQIQNQSQNQMQNKYQYNQQNDFWEDSTPNKNTNSNLNPTTYYKEGKNITNITNISNINIINPPQSLQQQSQVKNDITPTLQAQQTQEQPLPQQSNNTQDGLNPIVDLTKNNLLKNINSLKNKKTQQIMGNIGYSMTTQNYNVNTISQTQYSGFYNNLNHNSMKNSFYGNGKTLSSSKIGNERGKILYEIGMKKAELNKRAVEKTREIKQKEEAKECTFKPKLNISSKLITENKSKYYNNKTTVINQFNFKENVYERSKNWKNKKQMKHNNLRNRHLSGDYTFKPILSEANLSTVFKDKGLAEDESNKAFLERQAKSRIEKENLIYYKKTRIPNFFNNIPQSTVSSKVEKESTKKQMFIKHKLVSR